MYGHQVSCLLHAFPRQDPLSYPSPKAGCCPVLSLSYSCAGIGRSWPPLFERRATQAGRPSLPSAKYTDAITLIALAFERRGQETPCQRMPLPTFEVEPPSNMLFVLGIQFPYRNVLRRFRYESSSDSFCVNPSVSCPGVEGFLPTERRPNCMLESDMWRGR